MRVKNALKNGEIVVTGKQEPKTSRKGRKELVYTRVDAKTTALTATKEVVAMSDLS